MKAPGIQVATLHIKVEYAYGYLRGETGVHRLVRISPYDSAGRRQTSFASVDVLPEIDDTIDIVLRDDELKRDTFRSGGPGGQHQNKTESGVRYTHLPTGIAAESRSERSQHKNDANALALLKAKLIRLEEEKREADFAKKYDESEIVSSTDSPYVLRRTDRHDLALTTRWQSSVRSTAHGFTRPAAKVQGRGQETVTGTRRAQVPVCSNETETRARSFT